MTTRSTTDGVEMSTGQLVNAIKDDVTGLLRDEIDLAKAELREDAKAVGTGVALVAVAAVLVILVVILLSIALAYGLTALGLAPGWAFLIVAGVYLLAAGALGLVAKARISGMSGTTRAKQGAQKIAQTIRTSSES
ncbi:phage holin family protein [Phytoactinopolyspora alkaliphila]|uniref:Phage holin family protein n=1 Tax=Phytoactinopolyspora alkaliphila TaxID=1783498 RepID=A0A6N9YL47_9ACTN|nr:phage holin family protein [Phytoactinopolyspora alkaliphila]NED95801.1 phage holin family protein [Phytoactinopolyspora alkaliphila]